MRKSTLAIIAASLILSSTIAAAHKGCGSGKGGGYHRDGGGYGMMDGYYSNHSRYGFFAGVKLTDQQRQSMRDLMRQFRQQYQGNHMFMDQMFPLVNTDKFDESAVRKQLESLSRQNMEKFVEMARLRHEMYNLLTADQKAQVQKNHQRYLQERNAPAKEEKSANKTKATSTNAE